MKKLWPTLLGLSFGALVLWIFFAWLFTLFRTERDDGVREAAAHRTALEAYALAEVSAALRAQLLAASDQLEQAGRDPLLDDSALFLVAGEVQVVPPVPSREAPAAPATRSDDSPLLRREERIEEISAAVERDDRPGIERATRALLAERARYVIPISDEVPLVLKVVRLLQRAGPSPELMRMLLRDGVSPDGKNIPLGLEGLQRAVLRRKAKLSAAQLTALCAEVAKVSRELRVPAADFEARCQGEQRPRPPVWQLLEGESLWRAEAASAVWFVRAASGQAEGVAVDLKALISELTARLRARGLLSARDGLVLEVPAG
ncbi:MAG: sensor histidine kinase PhoR3, partial [Myxococcaceae bacterium]|nr:sensor histidine kinase PhoR3 [Myxococcaceae bacterium]